MKLLVPLALLASTAAALPLPLATGNVADLYTALGPLNERMTQERDVDFGFNSVEERSTASPRRRTIASPIRDLEEEDWVYAPDASGYHGRATEDSDATVQHGRATEEPDGIVLHGRATEMQQAKRMQNQKRETADPDAIIMHGRSTMAPERRNPITTANPERNLEEDDGFIAPDAIGYHGRSAAAPERRTSATSERDLEEEAEPDTTGWAKRTTMTPE